MTRIAFAALVVTACALAACARPGRGGTTPQDSADAQELQAMRGRQPHAAELVARGESLVATGALREGEALFRQAEAEDPNGALPWRRDCEARTALGERDEAVLACSNALQRDRSGTNVRALVRALVDGPNPPTTAQLVQALMLTGTQHERSPGSPAAAAAACTIAERTGNEIMLQRCAEELQAIAPDDPDTRKAIAALSSQCPPWRFWAGWIAILSAVVLTAAHAVRGLLRRVPKRAGVATVTAVFAVISSFSATAHAQQFGPKQPRENLGTRFPIDDEHPEQSVPSEKDRNADPLEFGYWIQDVASKADRASKKGDHLKSARLYEALALAVPDRAVGSIHACQEYEAAGDRDKAIATCAQALTRDGLTVSDYTRFVHLILGKPGRLAPNEVAALGEVLSHMREDPGGLDFVDELECEVGTRTSNVAQLKECTANLAARNPDDPKTISYEWALAIQEGNFSRAEQLIERARERGMASDSLDNMRHETAASARRHRIQVALALLAIALLLGGVGVAARAVARRRVAAPAIAPKEA